eukprot:6893373-Pyramimonas_sp.AAC.1
MPEILSGKRVSDHAGASVTISPRQKTDPDARPIPGDIFRMPEFQEYLKKAMEVADVSELSPPLLIEFHKKLMRSAAQHARD